MNTEKETSWILEVYEDPDTGELVMDLPKELIQAQKWEVGDTLVWNVNKDTGEVSLVKEEHDNIKKP